MAPKVEMPTEDMVDEMLDGHALTKVIVLAVKDDGSMEYYTDGCTSGSEAIGLVSTLHYLMIEDNIGKTRGFTFH